jgi:hypothetical protein
LKTASYGLDTEPEPELVKIGTGTVKNNYGSATLPFTCVTDPQHFQLFFVMFVPVASLETTHCLHILHNSGYIVPTANYTVAENVSPHLLQSVFS